MTIAMTKDAGKFKVTASKSSCNLLKDSYYGCRIRNNDHPEKCQHIYNFYQTCQMLCSENVGNCQRYLDTVGAAVNKIDYGQTDVNNDK